MNRKAYQQLVADTISFLKEQKGFVYVSKNSLAHFPPPAPAPIVAPAPVAMQKKALPIPPAPKPVALSPPAPPVAATPAFVPRPSSFSRLLPELSLCEKIPDDAEAKKVATRWKSFLVSAEAVLLVFQEKEEDLVLLKNLAKAMHTKLRPTKILDASRIEKEKKWGPFFQINTFKLILAKESTLTPELKLHTTPATPLSLPLLGGAPLLLLTPELLADKKTLWNQICRHLSSPQ